jgi:hypothetical protein
MAQNIIDIGVQGNDGTGDSIRTSFDKVNKNFTEIYAIFGGGGTIPFTQLADAPSSYTANQVIMAATTGGVLTARTIVGAGGVTINTSSNSQLVISTANDGLIGDAQPRLGAHLAATGFTIANLGDPSQALVDSFNNTYASLGITTTIDKLAITKGYADARYVSTSTDGLVIGPLKPRTQPLTPQIGISGYDSTLTGNYLSTEAMQRKDVVYRGGDTMTGALTLSDHPSPMAGQETPNSNDDLQAATKFYVDNNTYYSGTNLYVSSKGDDLQSKTPVGREGRAWQYAYKTVSAAALQADNLISLSSLEPGPYRQTIAYTIGPTLYKSTVQSITRSGGNYGVTGYEDAASLLASNKQFIQYETIAYLNKKYVNPFTIDQTIWTNIIGNIIDAVGYDLVLSSANGISLTNYNVITQASQLFNAYNSSIITNQLSQLIDGINYAKTQILDYTYDTTDLQTYIGSIVDALTYDLLFGTNYQSIQAALAFSSAGTDLSTDEMIDLLDATSIPIVSLVATGSSVTLTFGLQTTAPYVVGSTIVVSGMVPDGYNGTYTVNAVTTTTVTFSSAYNNTLVTPGTIVKNNIINTMLATSGVSTNETAKASLKANVTTFNNILLTSQVPDPTFPTLSTNSVGQISASNLLLANVKFIQSEVTAYITANYPSLSYDTTTSKRDIEYIIWSLVYDLLYGGNSQSVYAGKRYRYNSILHLTTAEQPACAAAIGYIATLVQAVVTNTSPVTLYQQTVSQYTNETYTGGSGVSAGIVSNVIAIQHIVDGTILTPAITIPTVANAPDLLETARTNILATKSSLQSLSLTFINANFPVINNPTIITTITSLFSVITNMLTLGYSTRTTPTYVFPAGVLIGFSHAVTAVRSNLGFITQETLAWMKVNAATYPYTSSTSNDSKSTRDLTFLLEAVCYDLAYGGTSASVKAANVYWANNTLQISGLNGILQACYNAINHAQTITKQVASNSTVTPVNGYTGTGQIFNPVWADGSSAGSTIDTLFNIIKDIIANQTVVAPTYPLLTNYDSSLQIARSVIVNNTTTIKSDTINYLLATYTGNFTYNEATCFRDLGYIIDGSIIDLLTGGNYQSVNSGKSYYRNSSARAIAIGSQYTETVDGITFARDLTLQVLNQTTANRFQAQYTQTFDNTKVPTTAAKNTFTSNYNIILSIITQGYGVAPAISFGSGIYTITFGNGGNGFVDQGGIVTVGTQSSIHIIPGKILLGNVSGANGQIVSYTAGSSVDTITLRMIQPGFFQVGETLDFAETVSNLNITIYVESGTYYEDYPIKLPANCTISGDDFRRTIIRPLNRISQSPWRNTFFYRDSVIDGIQTGVINFSTDYATTSTATISGISGSISITLGGGTQALASWVGKVFMDTTSETGTAGKAVINTVSGNVMNCTVIYPFASIVTYASGSWHLYGTLNYGRHYLTNPILTEGTVQATFTGAIVGNVLTVSNVTGTITIGQLVYGTNVTDGTTIIRSNGANSWIINYTYVNNVTTTMTIVNTPLNNKEIDVFLVNDATRIKLISCQGHGGFMMVLDPTGQIKTKSPYAQESGCFSGSLGTSKRFAGGQFIDGFAGRLFGTVSSIANSGKTITVQGSTNSGLDLRPPQVPCAFYITGNRFQINDVVSWSSSSNGSVTLTLDNSTPFNLTGVYNTSTSIFSNLLKYIVNSASIDMVTGSNYKSTVAGLVYLQPANVLGALGTLLVTQGITYADTAVQALSISSGNKTSIDTSLKLAISLITNGTSAIPTLSFPGITGGATNAAKAANIIQNNRTFLQAEIAAWISANFATQSIVGYSAVKSQRDTGYVLDAITYDLLYGGNSSIWDMSLSFYYPSSTTSASFTGSISGTTLTVSSVAGSIAIGQIVIGIGVTSNTVITGGSGLSWTVNFSQTVTSVSMTSASASSYLTSSGENIVCAAAMVRLSTVVQQCITNTSVSASAGNQLSQNTSLPTATSTEQASCNSLFSIIIDYLADGAMDGDVLAPSITSGSSTIVVSNNSALVSGATISGTGLQSATTISGTPVLGTGAALGTCTVTLNKTTNANVTNGILIVSGSTQTRTLQTISNSDDYTTINNAIPTIQTNTLSYLNTGAGIGINIEMGGNKSMLANDFTQVNDLGYGILCTNAGLTEQVSTFTYYCHTGYWALNGGQVRSIAGSNANGNYGLRATGYDITELPDSVNLNDNLIQSAKIYKQGSYATAMTIGTVAVTKVYIINYEYTPTNTSELEIDHTASGGAIVRYEISTVTHTPVTVNGQNVLELQLSTQGNNGTSSTGLSTSLYDGQSVTIRVLQNFKFKNINNVKPVRPSTALQFVTNLGDIYRIINYSLIESTGEPFAQNSGYSILRTDSSFSYYKLTTDTKYIVQADPTTTISATVAYGGAGNSTSSTTLTVRSVVGTIAIGQAVGGVGLTGQTVSSVTTNTATMSNSFITASTGILTVGTVSGTITVGMAISGGSIAAGTYIVSNISGSGAGSTWYTSTTTAQASTTITGTTQTVVISAVPSIAPVGPLYFASKTQGNTVSDTKIAVSALTSSATINQLNKGIYILGWNGRTHRIISYTASNSLSSGTYDVSSSGTTLKVSNVAGTISVGQLVTGTGFDGTHYVQTVTTTVSGSSTNSTITLNKAPSSPTNAVPSGTITFGIFTNAYVTIDSNAVYNNSSVGTGVNAMSFSSQRLLSGSTTQKIVTFTVPYNANSTTNFSVLPPVDSTITIANNTNTKYNGNYQVVGATNQTQITLDGVSYTTTNLAVGMVVSSSSANTVIPTGTVIQSIDSISSFTVVPAVWAPSGAVINAIAVAYIESITPNAQVGSGYTPGNPPTITLVGGSPGRVAVFTATVNTDTVNYGTLNITRVDPGYGYASKPSVLVTGGSGAVPALDAVLSQSPNQTTTSNGGINSVKLDVLYPVDPGTSGTSNQVASTGNYVYVSTTTNLSVGNQISFSLISAAASTLGNIVVGTTYYILSVDAGNLRITMSQTYGGSAFVPGTSSASTINFYSPSFGFGTNITPSAIGSPTVTGTGTYTVAYTIPSTAVVLGVYYYVSGNTNSLYNGYWKCTTATGTVTTITLEYPFTPGVAGAAASTVIAREITSATSSSLGISKAIPISGAVTLRAGYAATEAGQITVRISTCRATGHDFLDIGTGSYTTSNYPNQIYGNATIAANSSSQVIEETVGRVFYVTTDENGIFKVGRFFQVDQGTGTVTFSASIALSNLDGLGFKKGVVVTQFSTDSTMTENAPDQVPVQSAIRGFVDLRLGLDYSGNPVPTNTLIGPGYLPLNGTLAMKSNLNIGNNYIQNVYMASSNTSVYDGANRGYVDNSVAGTNSLSKLKDTAIQATGTYVSLSSLTLTVSNFSGTILPGQLVVNLATATQCTISGFTLSVGGIITGIFSVGMTITGPNITSGTTITALVTGTGGGGNYTISNSHTLPISTLITATGNYFSGQTVSSFTTSGANTVISLSSAPGSSPPAAITVGFTSLTNGAILTYDTVSSSWKAITLPTSTSDVTITYNASTGVAGSFTSSINNLKITNAMISASAAIDQSKLNMTIAGTAAAATTGTTAQIQASNGLANFDSAFFTTSNGWASLKSSTNTTSGILYTKIRYVSAGAILGNLTAGATTIQELTPGAVVASGDGIKNGSFTSGGAMTVSGDGTNNTYSVTTITTNSAANSLIKSDANKAVTVDALKVGGTQTTLSLNGTTLNITTPGGINAITAVGSSTSNTVITTTGSLDTTLGTLYATTLSTGVTQPTDGSVTGNWKVQSSSIWDVTQGTLKSTTLKTGTNTTTGDIEGVWSLTSGSIINTKVGTLKSTTLDAGNITTTYNITGSSGTTLKVADSTGIVAGMFVRGVGFTAGQTVASVTNITTVVLSSAPDVAPLAIPVNGQSLIFITPGTINGAWTLNGTLALSGISDLTFGTGILDISSNSSLLKVRHISTGLAATAGDVVGTWTVASGSTFQATSIVSQANSATITAELGAAGTIDKIIAKDSSGNFTIAGTMTGKASKANNLTGGNATTLLGSIPYQSAVDTTTLLAPNISLVKKYLTMTGNDTNGAAPVWSALGVIDATQTANTVYAGPSSGANVTATFRSLVSADIPATLTITELKTNILTANNTNTGVVKGEWTLDAGAKFQATYADLAEYYEGDQEYEPGTVLVFGGDKEVTTTKLMNDTRSAGVVSTDPAYTMNQAQTGIRVCIALAGRVPCKVVGRVKKGDMLTTSSTAGYAVKALNPTLGAIIGKALEDKDYGEAGVIQVAVGRV